MKKVFKLFSLMLALISIITLAACGNNDIKGTLEVTSTSTKITATASFNKNSILEESTTIVNVKLYDKDVTELIEKKTVDLGTEKVQGSVTFENLDTDNTYVLKLYVSYGGNEYFINEATVSTTSSGSSEEKPIEISTVSEFLSIEDDKDAYYKLTADLDFSSQAAVSLCSSSEPFEGVLDGNGHTIKNFSIAVGEYAGLFEYTEDATIKDLNLENASIEVTSSCKNLGALAGYAVNTDITNVTLDGFKVTTGSGPTTTAQFGGLVGAITSLLTADDEKNSSTIENSKALNINFDLTQVRPSTNYLFYCGGLAGRISGVTKVLSSISSGALNCKGRSSSGTAYIGGFAGAIESSQAVSKSASFVTISMVRYSNTFGRLCIGGFAGSNGVGQINLEDCIAVSDIIALADEAGTSTTANLATKAYIGGVVGLVESSPKGVKNCYYAKAKLGIMVKQAADTETTNYVDQCYVAETLAYAPSTVANKIKDVYTFDECLDVIGMTEVEVAKNEEKITVLSEENQLLFNEAIELRNAFASDVEKINLASYNFSSEYTKKTDVLFDKVSATVFGTSTILTLEDGKLIITPSTDSSAKTAVKISLAGSNFELNTILYITTAKAAA